jgi:Tfp pilus assembly protein PilF
MGIIENLHQMLSRGQDSALLRYSLGGEYLKAEDPGQALIHLAEAVRLDPGYSAAWKRYGQALVALGRHADAIEAFERGIRIAQSKGDIQAAKEMQVFRKRATRALQDS